MSCQPVALMVPASVSSEISFGRVVQYNEIVTETSKIRQNSGKIIREMRFIHGQSDIFMRRMS